MLAIKVALNLDVYRALRSVTDTASIAAVVAEQPAFGPEAQHIIRAPQEWFAAERMTDPKFWTEQDCLRDHIVEHLTDSVEVITPFLPMTPEQRDVPVVVYPVPGMTTCYGAPDGGQLFGLYDGTDAEEMLLFLSHTYYHELSASLSSEAARAAESDPSTAERFQRWVMLLIRNEGIANYAVLEPLRRLRDRGIQFHYFKYAQLVDNLDATAKAMFAYQQLMAMLNHETVEKVSRRVSAVLKNPRLPVINLIGIHMAEAIARHFGERTLLDVDQKEPEEFFDLFAGTGDPLCAELLGTATNGATA